MTVKEIKAELIEVRYYYLHKAAFDGTVKLIGNNSVMNKVDKYNKIMQSAPARFYDLYIGLYVNGYTQEAYAEEMGYCPQHICELNKNLITYIQKQLAKFLNDIETEINRNKKAAFVRNFQDNYESGDLPFYALVELFSFGTLSKFFKNMKNSDKKEIAKSYGVGYTYLESWFEHLAFVRNICAHYGRLYNSNLSISPILYKQYTDLGVSSLRIFASLVCLKHLLPNDKHWNNFIVKVSLLIDDFPCVNRDYLGFPNLEWEKLLSLPLSEIKDI